MHFIFELCIRMDGEMAKMGEEKMWEFVSVGKSWRTTAFCFQKLHISTKHGAHGAHSYCYLFGVRRSCLTPWLRNRSSEKSWVSKSSFSSFLICILYIIISSSSSASKTLNSSWEKMAKHHWLKTERWMGRANSFIFVSFLSHFPSRRPHLLGIR